MKHRIVDPAANMQKSDQAKAADVKPVSLIAAPEPSVHPQSRSDWRAWLEAHHTQAGGIWLVFYKKASGLARFDYNDAVEEALCFGWIDSKPSSLDAKRSLLWFAPRKSATGWSRLNKQRIERLMHAGLMHASGIMKVEQAQRDGSWAKLDTVEDLVIPGDLIQALSRYARATQHFEAFPRSAKRGILEWIVQAKTPTTRLKRIEETALLAEKNERANQWRGPRAKKEPNA